MCRAGGPRCTGGHSRSKSNQALRQRLSRANRAFAAAEATGDPAKIEAAQQKLTAAQASMDAAKQAHADETPDQTRDVTPVPTPQPTPKPEPKPPVSGRMSNNPILDNGWGDPSKEDINYHEDGSIGTALADMGPDQRMDVDGEPLANVLGRVATDVVAGRRTAQEGLDEYKAIRDRLPANSTARGTLSWAIGRIDAPNTPAPQVPDGTPKPLRRLVNDLHAVPIVRKDPSREMDQLVNLANDAAAGRTRGGRLAFDVQDLRNHRHESDGDAGKFEIDRAINKAVTDLRQPPARERETPAPQGDVTPARSTRKGTNQAPSPGGQQKPAGNTADGEAPKPRRKRTGKPGVSGGIGSIRATKSVHIVNGGSHVSYTQDNNGAVKRTRHQGDGDNGNVGEVWINGQRVQ